MPRKTGLLDLLATAVLTSFIFSTVLPLAMKGRDAANRVHCQNNLRQIGMALQQYAVDNREILAFFGPQFGHCAAVSTSNFLGTQRIRLADTQDSLNAEAPTAQSHKVDYAPFALGALYSAGYLKDPQVFRCAGDKTLRHKDLTMAEHALKRPGDYHHLYGSYFARAGKDERFQGATFSEQEAAIPMLLKDNAPTRAIVTEASGHHGPGMNTLFAEGRVSYVPNVGFKTRNFLLVSKTDGQETVSPCHDADIVALAEQETWKYLDRTQCARGDSGR